MKIYFQNLQSGERKQLANWTPMLTENILEERNQVRTISDNGITLVEERIGVFRKKKKAQMKV